MTGQPICHDGMRELQDRFGTRLLPDRLAQHTRRAAFTPDDRAFIEGRSFFMLATARQKCRPGKASRNSPMPCPGAGPRSSATRDAEAARLSQTGGDAMEYQLVIGQLLQTGLARAPAQRITDADQVGMSCADMGQRVGRCHRWALVRARAPWLRPGLPAQPGRQRGAVARRLAAHRRCRQHGGGWPLRITDRMKDVPKSGGEWISALAMECRAGGAGRNHPQDQRWQDWQEGNPRQSGSGGLQSARVAGYARLLRPIA